MSNTQGNNQLASKDINNYANWQGNSEEHEIMYLLLFKKNLRIDDISLILDMRVELVDKAVKRLKHKGLIKFSKRTETYTLNDDGGDTYGEY